MPGKTYIPRTTLSAGSNRINSNFANNLDHNPVVKAMKSRIVELEAARKSLIFTNNELLEVLNQAGGNAIEDISLSNLNITNEHPYDVSGGFN